MKLTFNELVASTRNLVTGDPGALSRFVSQPLPLKTSIRIKDLIRRVNELIADYYATRRELLDKYAKPKDGTDLFEFESAEQRIAFDRDEAELLAVEIDLPGPRLKISELLSSTVIAPGDLNTLDWLIDDGSERVPTPAKLTAVPSAIETPEPGADEDLLDLDTGHAAAAG